jgi:hypothetical protein
MLKKKFSDIEHEVKDIKPGYYISKTENEYFKNSNSLPLARIKKIMKLDDEVKVIEY